MDEEEALRKALALSQLAPANPAAEARMETHQDLKDLMDNEFVGDLAKELGINMSGQDAEDIQRELKGKREEKKEEKKEEEKKE